MPAMNIPSLGNSNARKTFRLMVLVSAGILVLVAGCAKMPLQQGTSLSSYQNLNAENGMITKTKISIDRPALAVAKTVKIIPTVVPPTVAIKVPIAAHRQLTSNAIDRALCVALSDRFQIVGTDQPADLTVRASIIAIAPTGMAAAGISTIASLGTSVFLPVPVPRLPAGLGGLSVEAEAIGADGRQKAAMIWARGADSFTTRARISPIGDAYSLAGSFGNDFATLLTKGRSPFKNQNLIPSRQKAWSALGGKNKYAPCEHFGRAPGIPGAIGGKLGFPPEWTEKKATENRGASSGS